MKTIVYEREIAELEIKPGEAIEDYRGLLSRDVEARLKGAPAFARDCPGCRGTVSAPVFAHFGLEYVQCADCGSVFLSPCPGEDTLTAFHRESESAGYWRSTLWERTHEARLRKVYRPRAEWILDTVARYRRSAERTIDLGYHSRLLIDELRRTSSVIGQITAANPASDLDCSGLEPDGVVVRPGPYAAAADHGPADAVLAFELINGLADVETMMAAATKALNPGGLLLLDAVSISGFDMLTLWDRYPNFFPPDRVNLLSTEGLTTLMARHGLEVLEFSTPGMFDLDIVARAVRKDAGLTVPRFVRYLVERRDENAWREFQLFLQQNRLSSYVRLAARKG